MRIFGFKFILFLSSHNEILGYKNYVLNFKRDWFLYFSQENSTVDHSANLYDNELLDPNEIVEPINNSFSSSSSDEEFNMFPKLKRKRNLEQLGDDESVKTYAKVLKIEDKSPTQFDCSSIENSYFLSSDEQNFCLDINEILEINNIKENLEKEVSCYSKSVDKETYLYQSNNFYDEFTTDLNALIDLNKIKSEHYLDTPTDYGEKKFTYEPYQCQYENFSYEYEQSSLF